MWLSTLHMLSHVYFWCPSFHLDLSYLLLTWIFWGRPFGLIWKIYIYILVSKINEICLGLLKNGASVKTMVYYIYIYISNIVNMVLVFPCISLYIQHVVTMVCFDRRSMLPSLPLLAASPRRRVRRGAPCHPETHSPRGDSTCTGPRCRPSFFFRLWKNIYPLVNVYIAMENHHFE